MVLLFQCKYRCVKLNMLKLAPKTEQDSNGTFHQGAFLLPRWPPGHLKAHICFDRCGFFCSLLSIKKSFRIGGSQIEENENPSNSAASGAGYPVQAQAFAAQSGLQRLPVCDDVHDILPAGLCGNRCMDQGQRDHAGCIHPKILAISTIAAIVTASVALLLMNFSRSGRTVDESRAWLKRICITWAILNGLGFIMAYVTPLFSGGQWTG